MSQELHDDDLVLEKLKDHISLDDGTEALQKPFFAAKVMRQIHLQSTSFKDAGLSRDIKVIMRWALFVALVMFPALTEAI